MKTTMTKFALPLLISVYSLPAQEFGSFHPFEMGGGIQFTMPKDDYHNSFGYKIGGVWNFSPRYGVNLTYGSTEIDSSKGNKTKTVSALTGGLELTFRKRDPVAAFTSIGMGSVSHEKSALFVFGLGLKIPVKEKILLRLELKEYNTEIAVPFISFPRGDAYVSQGGESRYLELSLSAGYTFGEKKYSKMRRPPRRRPY
tara:strand:+ start:11832 stop:12428 length:597 start_codon:yes stop_codon:yes gene_type:complete